jgi:hypothetical protein
MVFMGVMVVNFTKVGVRRRGKMVEHCTVSIKVFAGCRCHVIQELALERDKTVFGPAQKFLAIPKVRTD